MATRISLFIGSACYIGFIPGAPGTYASFATTLTFYLIYLINRRILPELHVSALCLATLMGVLAAARISRETGEEDPSFIVIDEVAGQLLTFLFVPVHLWSLACGTILFRVFDIWKPYPLRNLEHLKNGVGVMADDIGAGIYANLVLQVIVRLLHF
jgi:phosphatidylglycerophosphatase A